MDCARWPDSPFCGGDIPGSNRPGVLRPLAGLADFRLADWGSNDCESWVGFAPRLLGTTLSPPIYFHWREANCQPQTEPIEPELIPPTEPGGPARFWPNRSSQGRVQGCRYFVSIAIESDGSLNGQDWEFPAFNPWGHWSGLLAGICIPAYGPIAGIEVRDRGDFATVISIICGGVGMFPDPQTFFCGGTRLIPSVQGLGLSTSSWLSRLRRIDERGPSTQAFFHFPGVAPQPINREAWIRPYGAVMRCIENQAQIRSEPGQLHKYDIHLYGVRAAGLQEIKQAATVLPLRGLVWGQPCAAPLPSFPLPPSRGDDDPPMACCSCRDIERIIARRMAPIYDLLGFQPTAAPITINPESLIKQIGGPSFANMDAPVDVQVANIPQLLAAIAGAIYYRAGADRYPAVLPASLTDAGNNAEVRIQDAASWQEWLIKELDGLFGAYPIEFKYKNAEGEEKDIKLANNAEAQAEMMALLLSINADTDLLEALSIKTIVETIGARTAATTAADYGQAISEFLGYRTKATQRNLKIGITPGANTLREILRESTQKITRQQFDDENDLMDLLRQLLLGVGIVKAAMYRPYNEGDDLPGDRIRTDRAGAGDTPENRDWAGFMERLETPPDRERDANTLPPKIIDIGSNPPPSNPPAR